MKNLRDIVVVDDEASVREVVSRGLNIQGYRCFSAHGAEEAIGLIKKHPVAVVISDITMPGHNGIWLLGEVKKKWADTSVIMLTGVVDTQSAVSCLTKGADDYIVKPINLKELAFSVERVLEKRRLVIENKEYQRNLEFLVAERTSELRQTLRELRHSYDMTLQALVSSLDAREHETGMHSLRVSMSTIILAKKMGIKGATELRGISRGALLHDIGKIGIPDCILLKPGKLTPEEWVLMRRHPEIGHQILKDIDFLKSAHDIVLYHHERFDGTGYPYGLKGDDIPLPARIFLVMDAYDTMMTDRPYRKAISEANAIKEIKQCAGTQLDPKVTEVFLSIPKSEWQKIRRFTTV